MLAVAIVALFIGSRGSVALGIGLGAVSLYLLYSAVHLMAGGARRRLPVIIPRSGLDWALRTVLSIVVALTGLIWGTLAVSHKCSAGNHAFEAAAPFALCALCGGTVLAFRRYSVAFLILILLLALALLGGSYYQQVIHRGAPETMLSAPNKRSALDARTSLCLHIERHWPGASESER